MTWFNTTPAPPPWIVEARRLMGVAEVPGPKSNSVILGWAKALGGWVAKFYTADSLAWCSLFASHCIQVGVPGSKLPSNPLGALAWKDFGQAAPPVLGAIMVFTRPGGGHVGFLTSERADAYRILSGNQSDRVCEAWIAKNRLVACRWPIGYPVGTQRVLVTGATGALSKNEA